MAESPSINHLLNNFLCFLVILSSTTVICNAVTVEDLKKQCPHDSSLCLNKVAQNECFGSSLKAKVLQKKCQCSCDYLHHQRIQNCCETVGEDEMRFCLPLCRYNTTTEEELWHPPCFMHTDSGWNYEKYFQLGSSLGLKCISQLTTWAYCAADATDQSSCCEARGVPPECRSFCKGDVPTCDMQSIITYQPCLQYMGSIIQCQKTGLGPKPRFDPSWYSECDWQG